MNPKKDIYFLRTFRTPSSEVWEIDFEDVRIGTVHLHFTKCILGDVILSKKITNMQLQNILESLEDWIVSTIESRDDFIFSVYQAKEIGFYSDRVDHDEYAPTRKDLKEHGILINKLVSKFQDARGQLHEHVVKDYFTKLGFHSIKANELFDALKVDIIAEDDKTIIYCQVKLGKVDNRKMYDICKTISSINDNNTKRKIIGIVSESFPSTVEQIKDDLENEFGLRIWTISKSQILNDLPQYKRTLHSNDT
jgi:Holliday junction resolvase-like predicted endonuclease